MAEYYLKLPKMGEGVEEATITNWLKKVGDKIEIDDSIVEIATDKVDSDIVSEVSGKLLNIKFNVNDVVKIGDIIATIETNEVIKEDQFQDNLIDTEIKISEESFVDTEIDDNILNKKNEENILSEEIELIKSSIDPVIEHSSKYYSPLVKSIAEKEGLTSSELKKIKGTGKDQRVTKKDIILYLSSKKEISVDQLSNKTNEDLLEFSQGKDQVIEMTRMEKILSSHMTDSIKKSAHVQSFIEVDVTDL